ncbi:MAG: TrkA C-terminal domain-containing protein [Woeseiaceae bacterium]|nr:TrkA C-terminal domain-containing protein [Woeseiaceae bacterium]
MSDDSPAIGKRVRDLDELAEKSNVEILGLVRGGERMPGFARVVEVQAGDTLVVEAHPESIEGALGSMGPEYIGAGRGLVDEEDLQMLEAVVPESSRLIGRSVGDVRLLYRDRVALVGVSRGGKRFREDLRKLSIKAGDVLLLLGADERLGDATSRLGLLPLSSRLPVLSSRRSATSTKR